jgi:hypothetical protein
MFKFFLERRQTKDSDLNGNKNFLNLICSQFVRKWYFDLLLLLPNILTSSQL